MLQVDPGVKSSMYVYDYKHDIKISAAEVYAEVRNGLHFVTIGRTGVYATPLSGI